MYKQALQNKGLKPEFAHGREVNLLLITSVKT